LQRGRAQFFKPVFESLATAVRGEVREMTFGALTAESAFESQAVIIDGYGEAGSICRFRLQPAARKGSELRIQYLTVRKKHDVYRQVIWQIVNRHDVISE
jgi:hypothetical protein